MCSLSLQLENNLFCVNLIGKYFIRFSELKIRADVFVELVLLSFKPTFKFTGKLI